MSETSYDTRQRLDAVVGDGSSLFGPWEPWNPLSNGWSVRSPYTAAWVRAAPGNMAILSLWATCPGGGNNGDGTVVGTIPAEDAAGNPLRPAQAVQVMAGTDSLRCPVSPNNEGAYFQINPAGSVSCYGFASNATFGGISGGWYPLDAM